MAKSELEEFVEIEVTLALLAEILKHANCGVFGVSFPRGCGEARAHVEYTG